MAQQKIDLLQNASATGDAAAFEGGRAQFMVLGNFAGASVQLQQLGPDSLTYVDVGDAITAPGAQALDLPRSWYKATVSGGTSPSGLYASLQTVPSQ